MKLRVSLADVSPPSILRIAYELLVHEHQVRDTAARYHVRRVPDDRDDFPVRGILARSSATVVNIGASIWVMDPAIQTVANTVPLPDYVQDEIRSIPGVKYAVSLHLGAALLKLGNGAYQAANAIGLDDTSLFGRPQLLASHIEDIFAESAFIAVKDAEFVRLGNPQIATDWACDRRARPEDPQSR